MRKVVEPRSDETRSEFISRCMSVEAEAFPDRDQRLAVCSSMFQKSADGAGLRQGRRRRMTKFTIDELSSVDLPAQEGARAILLKRKGEPGYDPDNPDPSKRGRRDVEKRGGLVLLTSADERHAHGLMLFPGDSGGNTWQAWDPEDELVHDHAWVLGDDGTITIAENAGHTHTVDENTVARALMSLAASEIDDRVVMMAQKYLKRTFSAEERKRLADEGKALPDGSFPIVNRGDLRNAIQAFGRAGSKTKVARHIASRARAIGATDLLPEEGELARRIGKREDMMPENTPTAEDQVKELEKKLARAEKMAELTDAEKAHLKGLDESAQATFLAKSADDRKAEVKAEEARKAKADEVVYTDLDGNDYRKSDDARVVAAVKRADEATKRAAESEALRKQAELEKRASDELGNLPGEVSARAALLKAIDDIPNEEHRKGALEAVHAGNKAIQAAFATKGHEDGTVDAGPGEATEKLEKMARELASKDGISYVDAYAKVSEANPELLKKAITE